MKKAEIFIKITIIVFIILILGLLGLWSFTLRSYLRTDKLEDEVFEKQTVESIDSLWCPPSTGDWYMQLRFDEADLTIKIRLDTLWQIAESVWIERRVDEVSEKQTNGFWVYWTPHIEASGDTFVVTMADSLWMTGDTLKTMGTLRHGWRRWGLWFYVR